MRALMFGLASLALAACAGDDSKLWTPDEGSAGLPPQLREESLQAANALQHHGDRSLAPMPATPVTVDSGPVPANPRADLPVRRRGSGTSPDILFPEEQPAADPRLGVAPRPPVPERHGTVLQPADPLNPYSADGAGAQRQGNTIVTPNGNATITGDTIFGPDGKRCQAVGNTLMCN